jgi:hypothetical protein
VTAWAGCCWLGWLHRKHKLPRLREGVLAAVEVALMAAVLVIALGLSNADPTAVP